MHPPISAANEGSLQRADSLGVQAFSTVRAQFILCKKGEGSKEWAQHITGYSFILHSEDGERHVFLFNNNSNNNVILLTILLLWSFEAWKNTVCLLTFVGLSYVVKLYFNDNNSLIQQMLY